ncbi:TIGR02206 family membrane protein [Pseudonocardia sp. NPDC046786]|uniref:YwaF family protein n=1 Tax=Pseudonocardia sp. NPDC046786 TaxID=3155471 RepID=UPI0033FA4CDA
MQPDDDVFVPYGTTHWTALTIGAAVAVLLVLAGQRMRGTAAQVTTGRVFALVIVGVQLSMQVRRLLPENWDLYTSLPLQLSDLSWVAAAYALWTHRWWACALTYYWGLTLTPQALLTPALDSPDFPRIEFLDFWALHLFVTWAAVYLTWGVGIRPTWRGMRATVAATVGWAVVAFSVNSSLGTNYGFLDHKPSNPSLLDLLGPWPWYLLVEFTLVVAGWCLITWPWTRSRQRADTRAG